MRPALIRRGWSWGLVASIAALLLATASGQAQQKPGAPATSAEGAAVVAPGSTAEKGAADPNKARVEIFGQIL